MFAEIGLKTNYGFEYGRENFGQTLLILTKEDDGSHSMNDLLLNPWCNSGLPLFLSYTPPKSMQPIPL
jgi:hypothetical protein